MANAPGKTLLKVVGILFIIFGAITAILTILALIGGGLIASIDGVIGGAMIVASIIGLVGAVLEIIVGILGVKFCDKPEKATILLIIAIILIVLQIVSLILGGTIWSAIIGLILPVLFLIGAIRNKNAVSAA